MQMLQDINTYNCFISLVLYIIFNIGNYVFVTVSYLDQILISGINIVISPLF